MDRMELLEDVYVDELIDAFDAPEAEPAAPTGPSDESHRQHRRAPGRQRTQSALELRTTRPTALPSLYPVFGESRALRTLPDAAGGAAIVPCEPREATSSLEHQAPLSRQTFCDSQLVTDGALQRARQQIEHEMRVYRARLDHVAKALAGETAHQIRARKQREEEQLERRGKRCEAVETRLLHQLNRREERKQRRTRVCHAGRRRVSRSLSPGTACTSQEEHGERGAKEAERL